MKNRMEELVNRLNEAARAYYQFDREIMSNQEYDTLYDELSALEKKTGIVLSSSPTHKVGYEIVSSLPKEDHPSPMLSLDKTKSTAQLAEWLGDKTGLLSWKLDGLTVVLTYEAGRLTKAVTRGDGITGEVITPNARTFVNIPLTIPETGTVTVRGEAVISYEDFEKINNEIMEQAADGEVGAALYKNPRNLCSGSVRQLNSEITAKRHVRFYVFTLAQSGSEAFEYRHEELEWVRSLGFETVEYVSVTSDSVENEVGNFERKIGHFEIPSDGLVLTYDDIAYGQSLGSTVKFPRDSIAFKWQDETKETTLTELLWNPSRTGLINPIAVFEPVQLEGTTVSRASVHNLSIVEELELGIGDTITVYKANMIIPQIADNLTRSGAAEPPDKCPVCGSKTLINDQDGVRTLRCPSPSCPAKQIKAFTHFVSRNAMNIEGLSEATIEKFVDEGMITDFADIFTLSRWRDKIVSMDGFGEKSYANIIDAVERARHTTPARLLLALGIPGIGAANAGMIAAACHNKWTKIQSLTADELTSIEGVGDIMAGDFTKYFSDENNKKRVAELLQHLDLDESYSDSEDLPLAGKTFVITGKLNHYENRDAARAEIQRLGGKVSSSVSKNTDYLINNDADSASSKNKKAKQLGTEIITEDEFLKMIN